MEILIGRLAGLLIVAVVVAILARRFHLPYTVGLVLAGFGIAVLGYDVGIVLTRDVIFNLVLPPLLFEAALNLRWTELKKDRWPILGLSILGVLISAGVVASAMVQVAGWTVEAAVVFGVLIAATDPVAVIAMFKDNHVVGRLRLLVESESLFNDGVAAVFFTLVLGWAASHTTDFWTSLFLLAKISGGGIVIGIVVGSVALLLADRLSDHLVEMAVTTSCAYASFLAAESLGVSGVLATVSAGLLVGTLGLHQPQSRWLISAQGRTYVLEVWEFLAFVANSFIFLLIGLTVARTHFGSVGHVTLGIAILAVLLGRAATVYPVSLLFRHTAWRIPVAEQHVLWWGGLRGALALALSLSLPASIPQRGDIIVVTFCVSAFSIVCQGMTMPLLLRRLGIARAVRS